MRAPNRRSLLTLLAGLAALLGGRAAAAPAKAHAMFVNVAFAMRKRAIESEDETGDHWTTVGVSPNIIDASFQALMDSIVYKLVKAGAPA